MEIENENQLDRKERIIMISIEQAKDKKYIICLNIDIFKKNILFIDFEDSEFFNILESVLIQWQCLTQQSDIDNKTIYLLQKVNQIDKGKLNNFWEQIQQESKIVNIENETQNENYQYTNLLKPQEIHKIQNQKITNFLNLIYNYEGFFESNEYYQKFTVQQFKSDEFLKVDQSVFESLCIFPDKKKSKQKNVYGYINQFVTTNMASRTLRQWLLQPVKQLKEINYRSNFVQMYLENSEIKQYVKEFLKYIPDIDPILIRLQGSMDNKTKANLKDCYNIYQIMNQLDKILMNIQQLTKNDAILYLIQVLEELQRDTKDLKQYLEKNIDLQRVQIDNEFFVNPQSSGELQQIDMEINKLHRQIERHASDVKQQLGFDVNLNKEMKGKIVFEAIKSDVQKSLNELSSDFKVISYRKRILTFTSNELSYLNEQIQNLKEQYSYKQQEIKKEIIKYTCQYYEHIEFANYIFIEQDLFLAFALMYHNPRDDNTFCVPVFIQRNQDEMYSKLQVQKAWHINLDSCISNDVDLETDKIEMNIITGPNMGGKSTYIRKIAICVLLAHIGCPVPAQKCELTIFSSIHTRIGASDDQQKGKSTFMNEMVEISNIVNTCDSHSLVVIDELGRGTSVYEGLGLSQAITEHLAIEKRCLCLIATHFFELTQLAKKLKHCENYHMQTILENQRCQFTYKLYRGYMQKSYGIEIIKQLDFPEALIKESEKILEKFEKYNQIQIKKFIKNIVFLVTQQNFNLNTNKRVFIQKNYNMSQKKKVGNYLLVNKVGEGQFGKVFKGRLISDKDKVYAVKQIEKKRLEGNSILNRLFQTEMSVMSEINHPNIMHLYEFMETNHNYYLVIQYCNNGDLEGYLKKMGRLSEDEAVYFLMQIMNGFRVLHKHKVMHRDVKLANIFLQDDKVVIGDFGFAKQGVEVTKTRLGTPITMAPELLTTKEGSYTNKADLWSIGVCFYQILFGKTPFDAKNYGDLKIKVKQLSGKNLKFPPDVPISQACKDLLINLLQYDPKKRLEWVNFFNHKLFDLHSNKQNKPQDFNMLNNSLIHRDNQDQVQKEFKENKHDKIQTQNLPDPQKLEPHKIQKKTEVQETEATTVEDNFDQIEKCEEAFKYIRARYCHEKKKIIFIMYTVRKLRNLAKMKYVFNAQLSERFMLAACLLLQKGLLLNNLTINSLKKKVNTFELREFNRFLDTPDNPKIQQNFLDDAKIYQTFSKQMSSKFSKEVTDQEYRQEHQKYLNLTINELSNLDNAMYKHFQFFKNYLQKLELSQEVEANYCVSILHFYNAIFTDKQMPFIQGDKIFEWKQFEKQNSTQNAKYILFKQY